MKVPTFIKDGMDILETEIWLFREFMSGKQPGNMQTELILLR